ncbi:phenylalanine--tRNA ligase subunit alpha [Amycolatopsis sp. VS8301801F10]|uniref:phenylalanine--tRNA ligase subunit alpha n=1 Tax=Amycolatopsis sp. VS8301801F10 TaxID=2652442 RepID=UPI0038FCBD91
MDPLDPASTLRRITALTDAALAELAQARTPAAVADARRSVLGKSSPLAAVRRDLGQYDPASRKQLGLALSEAHQRLAAAFAAKAVAETALDHPLDPTIPGLPPPTAGLHPVTQLRDDLDDAFRALNFTVVEGPEISSAEREFDRLNFPADHPARESMDTYWLADGRCLRPHLTGASVRHLSTHAPPVRIAYPGRVYRNESTDARHERAFFQYEVLVVDDAVPLATARFLVDTILGTVFGEPVRTRMRAGYFPFVEPGFEIDMACRVCSGRGCRTCGRTGWLEVMPGGSPHPHVLRAAGLDPARWSGCYLNVGLDRLAMMRYGIDDVRLMHSADLRFLTQFA